MTQPTDEEVEGMRLMLIMMGRHSEEYYKKQSAESIDLEYHRMLGVTEHERRQV